MFNNKGSALIIVLIIMSFIMLLAVSNVKVTHSEETMAKLYNDSNSAYYICESGIERTLSIIKKDLNQEFINDILANDETLQDDPSLNNVKFIIDTIVNEYFRTSFDGKIYKYQNYVTGSDGKTGSNGEDTKDFSNKNNAPTYYKVTLNTSNVSTINPTTKKYEKIIKIDSTGHSGKLTKKISADYLISFVVNNESGSEPGTKPKEYPDLSVYCKNALNLIGYPQNDTVTNVNYNFAVNGNVLITGKSLTISQTVNINNGSVAVRNTSINNSGFTNISGDFILDTQSAGGSGNYVINNGSLYSPVTIKKGTNFSKFSISQYNKTWGNQLLKADKSGIRDFALKPIINSPDFPDNADFPDNDRGINYYYHPETNPDISKHDYNRSYNVLICKNDLTIPNNFEPKKGLLIYCTGTVTFSSPATVSGVIIAKNIILHEHNVSIRYEIPNESNGKIDDIIQTITDNTGSESTANISGYGIKAINRSEN